MPVTLNNTNITINDGTNNFVVETVKTTGQNSIEVPIDEPDDIYYGIEQLYPSVYARANYFHKIDGVSPDSYTVAANTTYATGTYNVKYSSIYIGGNYSPHNIFYKPNPETNPSWDATWASHYSNGNYVSSNNLGGKNGDWVTIQMPVKILLTNYIFASIHYNNSTYRCRLPHKYTIFGCNNDDGNWEEIYSEDNSFISSNTQANTVFSNTYINPNDSYKNVLTDSDRKTGNKVFNTFGLVVEKTGGWNSAHGSLLAMAEWEIYGRDTEIIEKDDESYIFKHDGSNSNQTLHTIKINTPVTADILIIGGGGAGGNSMGGGGGAGGVVYTVNQTLSAGTYTIGVGKGGIGLPLTNLGQGSVGVHQDGKDSFIKNSNGSYVNMNMGGTSYNLRGFGGGGGAVYYNRALVHGRSGGSGGGSSEGNRSTDQYNGGTALQPDTFWNGSSYVKGGSNGNGNITTDGNFGCGGGGGAGQINYNGIQINGKTGVLLDITGVGQYYAAGGGGGQYNGNHSYNPSLNYGLGGNGIGGDGRIWDWNIYKRDTTSGLHGTGSGGGGGAYVQNPDNPAGSGGSGVVIIRIKDVPIHKTAGDILPHNKEIARQAFGSQNIAINTELELFRNYSPALFEPFISDPTTHLSMNERKGGAIGGYIFLEKNEYTDLYTNLTYNGIVLGGVQLFIEEVLSSGHRDIVQNQNKADGNNKDNFTITESGFYRFRLYFVLYNRWQDDVLNQISFTLNCKKGQENNTINLKDYMYKGNIYPANYDNSIATKEFKINKFNNDIIKGLKFEGNDKTSVEKFKSYINNDTRDYFNIKYWDTFIVKSTIMLNNKVLLTEECTDAGEPCRLLRNIVTLKNLIVPYIDDDDKINELFNDVLFTSPTFKHGINITSEFTNGVKDITSFITYEKDNNPMNRTQQNITDDLFSFKTRLNTIKSIYVKK